MATGTQWAARAIFVYWFGICQIWFLLSVYTFLNVRRRFRKEVDSERSKTWKAFDRLDYDIKRKDLFALWFGSLTVFPLKFPFLVGVAAHNVLCLMLFSTRCTLDVTLQSFDKVTKDKLPARVQRDQRRQHLFMKILRWLTTKHCEAELALLNVWTIREWKVLNHRFDFDQFDRESLLLEPLTDKDRKELYRTRCFLSNHVSIADALFFITRLYPSFLAKSAVFDDPLIGPCARALNCVFLNRRSSSDRERTIRVLDERQKEIWKLSMSEYAAPITDTSSPDASRMKVSPKMREFLDYACKMGYPVLESNPLFTERVPPLLVFPEGTTSSGRHLIPLKRGAFLGLRPVTPVVLIYRCPAFGLSFDVLPLMWSAPLMLSNLRLNTLDVYWLREVLPPAPWSSATPTTPRNAGGNENHSPPQTATQRFCQDVWIRMSRVLSTMCHWELPRDEDLPFTWTGSMQTKQECIAHLFR